MLRAPIDLAQQLRAWRSSEGQGRGSGRITRTEAARLLSTALKEHITSNRLKEWELNRNLPGGARLKTILEVILRTKPN